MHTRRSAIGYMSPNDYEQQNKQLTVSTFRGKTSVVNKKEKHVCFSYTFILRYLLNNIE